MTHHTLEGAALRRLRTKTPLTPQSVRLNRTDVAGQHRFYADVQQKRVDSALLASGITAVVYSFLQSGTKCTCRLQASLLDADGNLSDEGVRTIISDAEDAGHVLAGEVRKPTLEAADVGLDEVDDSFDRLLRDLEAGDDGLEDGDLQGLDSSLDELGELDPDLPAGEEPTFFGGMNQDRCGVCFGSGFEGGFKLVGGFRTVLTTKSETVAAMTDCAVDRRRSPHRFSGGRRVTFDNVRLPYRTGQRLHVLRLWRNDAQLPRSGYVVNRATIEAAVNDGTGAATNHNHLQGDDVVSIQVTVEAADGADDLDFSHLEIQALHRRPPIDIIQVPDDFHPHLTGAAATATLQLPPDAPVSKFSIIRDSKYGRAWQVGRVTPHLNNRGTAVWFEVEARLVAQHELRNRLPG